VVPGIADLTWQHIVVRMLLAAALGAAIGVEREYDGQDAGLRTNLLVVLGSALFAAMSVGGFQAFITDRNSTNLAIDVSRIAAYVPPGIGFIGGGVILKHRGRVSGLTTAATMWTGAAIGIACGLGAWQSALITTGIVIAALEGLRPLSVAIERMDRKKHSALVIDVDDDCDLSALTSTVQTLRSATVRELVFGSGPDDGGEISVRFWEHPDTSELANVADRLRDVRGVRTVKVQRVKHRRD
jgi:putative Mg2+ transporter-C (MgtC) family protein